MKIRYFLFKHGRYCHSNTFYPDIVAKFEGKSEIGSVLIRFGNLDNEWYYGLPDPKVKILKGVRITNNLGKMLESRDKITKDIGFTLLKKLYYD